MAAMDVRVALLGLLLVAGSAGAASVNPIDKVLSLMDGLAAKVTKEGEDELKAWNEYYQWCQDSSKDTRFTIKTATSSKENLEATIGKATADISAAATEIDELAAGIAKNEADLTAATGIRDKEHSDFSAVEGELMDGIEMLDRAVSILSQEMSKNPALLQKSGNTAGSQGMLQLLDTMITASAFSGADRQKLLAMVQSKESTDDEELGAPAGATFKTHSTGVVDMLEDMKEKAESELADARKAESSAKHNFGMLKGSLEGQLFADNKDLSATKAAKADAAGALGGAKGDLAVNAKVMSEAHDTLDMVSGECMSAATNHGASMRSRAEELSVIAEAKKIVVEATGGAAGKVYSLLQTVSSTHSKLQTRADLANMEIVAAVKKLAAEQHSTALSQLASRISAVARYGAANGDDVFAKIKGLVSDMIAKLQKEAAEAATEKAFCDEEMAKTAAKKQELNADIDALTAKIDKAAAHSAKLKEEVAGAQKELANLAKTQSEMDVARMDENKAFAETEKDLKAGIYGVQKALEVLRSYYGSASAALVQDDTHFAAMMQQPSPPEGHSAAGGAGGSIINVLEVCEADFTKELTAAAMTEQEAAADYEKMTQQNTISKQTKNQDVKYKTKEFKGDDKFVAEHSSDKAGLQTELDAVLEYSEKINSKCVAQPESYAERKAKREAEIAGLKDALQILDSEGVFLQRPRRLRKVSAAL